MSRIRYSASVEFEVDDIISGGPSRTTIRRTLREFVANILPKSAPVDWGSVDPATVRVRYLHESTQHSRNTKKGPSK